nr:uncharacterized protein LOC110439521 [Danio rerio]|eukprot:XP_021331275.1 uncharacterized protein LOC110439521 [Danio rerio]
MNNENINEQANNQPDLLNSPSENQPLPAPPGSQPEPEAVTRGRRMTRSTATRSRQNLSPTQSTPRQQISSPTSSYISATSSVIHPSRITVSEIRNKLAILGINAPKNLKKPELLKLYKNATSDSLPSASPPPRSAAQENPIRFTPYPQASRSQPGKKKSKQKHTASHSHARSQHQETQPPPMTSLILPQQDSIQENPASLPLPLTLSTPFSWPPAPSSSLISPHLPSTSNAQFHPAISAPPALPPNQSSSFPPPSSSAPPPPSQNLPFASQNPPINIPSFSSSLPLAHSNSNPTCSFSIPNQVSSTRPPFTLSSATPLPPPNNALAMEPPPISNSARNLILSGADIDLISLLSPIAPPAAERQVDCGEFSVSLKSSVNNQSRTLTLAEFCIAFSRFTDTICSVYPHRRRELNDYMAIIAELALSYGGTHFFTYHKLFSAKCALRVTQWNQCPYWGALDTELHNRVFLGCRNLTCAVCRSCLHPTTSCPLVNPLPDPTQPPSKSTSYVPNPSSRNISSIFSIPNKPSLPSRDICQNFNLGRCHRMPCRYLHLCSYCGGAHAKIICQILRANNKKSKNYLSTPVNISNLARELKSHPDTNFSDFLIAGLTHGFHPEILATGPGSRPSPNACTSVFRNDIAINHPLHNLHQTSLSLILQAIAPRTLNAYLTAWNSFKQFHIIHQLPFPDFSLLSITSFISHLHTANHLQASSIKSYLSGIQFFHKLIHGSPSDAISNSQTSLLIKGIQKNHPTSPDARQPITLKILTSCIHTLRKGYISSHTARTLDAMFNLAFFGFLRCSELTVTSKFNPLLHPTISDLALQDKETISFLIKQSKTDQTQKGHSILIFDIPSPTRPFQTLLAYLNLRKSQEANPMAPLFTDDANRPVSRFWFQKHLKEILRLSGFSPEPFSSHSFRIGAATTAASNGLSHNQIQTLGRWSSEAFKSYIRLSKYHLKEAQKALTNPQATSHKAPTHKGT